MTTKRTTLLLDVDLLARAAEQLGTERPTDTVRAALAKAARREHVRNLVEWELPDEAERILAEQRTSRHP